VTASLPAQTVSLLVSENQAIVAAASDGTATTEYWVRCLPPSFPPMSMVQHPDAGAPPPGYYLVGTDGALASPGYAMVLDGNGVPLWYYEEPVPFGVVEVDNVVSGAITFMAYVAPAQAPFELYQLSPLNVSYVAPTGTILGLHELRTLSNGHWLVISNPIKNGVDLTGLDFPLVDGGVEALGPGSSIVDCNLVEFDPTTGRVVWKWIGSDHLDPAKDSTWPQLALPGTAAPDGGTAYDVFHCNSIDVDPNNGNLLVSARHMDSVFYVDRSSGAVLWKMGGSSFTKDGATYVPVADPFFRQHDARLQPGWAEDCYGGRGQVSLFDDHTAMTGVARGVIYDVTVGAPDGGAAGCDGGMSGDGGAGASMNWQYAGSQSSASQGSFRILPDGSRVIGWGYGPTNLIFTEVDSAQKDMLDFYFTNGNSSYRAIKVPTSAFDLSTLHATAGSSP
jgi:hypothetical protein